MDNRTAKAMLNLSMHPDFKIVWDHFRQMSDLMKEEILVPGTDMASREILVRINDVFVREVINMPEAALRQVNKETAGQAEAPA